tara:strand:- start:1755 stop:2114 length:360 start_codon:yes stop_codon:yes gene_type:complete
MSWEDVLKVLTPRMFLENIQNIVGGEIRGSSTRGGDRYSLHLEKGKITVTRKGSSAYNVRFGNFNANSYDLAKLLPRLLDSLNGEMEKVAGTVTTSSAPALFSEGRMGGGKNAKDEEKD